MSTELELIDSSQDMSPLKTASPSGRYDLAWGVPGVTGLAKRLADNRVDIDTSKVRNYLIERRTMSIVGTLPLHTRRCRWDGHTTDYKSGGNHYRVLNHSSMATFWSRAEDWVLVWHDGVWWYRALYLGHRTPEGFHFVEVGDKVEDAVRAELRRRYPHVYDQMHQADGRNPYVGISKACFFSSMISLEVQGGVPHDNSNPLNFQGNVEMRFADRAHNIHAEIASLHLQQVHNGYW